eukprot:6748136-Prymnesium_polylepis.1
MVDDHSGVGLCSCEMSSGSSGIRDEMTQTGCGTSCWKPRSCRRAAPRCYTLQACNGAAPPCAVTCARVCACARMCMCASERVCASERPCRVRPPPTP